MHGEDFGVFDADATYSNSIIDIHQGKHLLVTTNVSQFFFCASIYQSRSQPGSNTVSLFRIDPKDPAKLTTVGDPVPSFGDFPTSVAFNHAGDRLCVMNSGRAASIMQVLIFCSAILERI